MLVFAFVVVAFVMTIFVTLAALSSKNALVTGLVFVMFLGGSMLLGYYIIQQTIKSIKESMRLRDFAATNGLEFSEYKPPDNQPGLIFGCGDSRMFTKQLTFRGPSTQTFFGNYQYTTGSGKSRQVHTYGVLRISISRKLPHVVLDARSNNFLGKVSNISFLDSSQKIELEGDFSTFFDVYAPRDYGRDMLYWLTPELMEILKTHFAQFDIELVDNHVYLYKHKDFTLDQTGVKNILETAEWLHGEFEQNTRRYSDDRVGSFAANTVSEPGRRLKKKIPWWLIVGFILWVVFEAIRIIR
jgi:hypothetical protein